MLICAGQSNMLGTNQLTGFPEDSLVTYNAGNRAGPCYYAAILLAHSPTPRKVIAVQCAVGGTSISRWIPGADLYEACVNKVRSAQGNQPVPYVGLIFYQGEDDYKDGLHWPQMFTQMVQGFRSDLKNVSLPIVYAQLGAEPGLVPSDQILWGAFQDSQATAQQPGIEMIMVKDLPTSDGIHHGTTYDIIGQRFANDLLSWGE